MEFLASDGLLVATIRETLLPKSCCSFCRIASPCEAMLAMRGGPQAGPLSLPTGPLAAHGVELDQGPG